MHNFTCFFHEALIQHDQRLQKVTVLSSHPAGNECRLASNSCVMSYWSNVVLTRHRDGFRLLSNFPVVWPHHAREDIISLTLRLPAVSTEKTTSLKFLPSAQYLWSRYLFAGLACLFKFPWIPPNSHLTLILSYQICMRKQSMMWPGQIWKSKEPCWGFPSPESISPFMSGKPEMLSRMIFDHNLWYWRTVYNTGMYFLIFMGGTSLFTALLHLINGLKCVTCVSANAWLICDEGGK